VTELRARRVCFGREYECARQRNSIIKTYKLFKQGYEGKKVLFDGEMERVAIFEVDGDCFVSADCRKNENFFYIPPIRDPTSSMVNR